MPDEKTRDHNGREISMKDYIDLRIDAVEKGITLARDVMEHRLNGMNEFRESLQDASQKHVQKDECNVVRKQFGDDIRELRDFRAEMTGKASMIAVYGAYGIALIGAVGNLILYFAK